MAVIGKFLRTKTGQAPMRSLFILGWIMNTGPDGGNKLNPRTLSPRFSSGLMVAYIIASKPGGIIITVMLIGHGSPDGVNLGEQILNPAALTSRCSRFPADVQINIVIKACYSGVFAKAFKVSNQRKTDQRSFSGRRSAISGRVRNSVFGAAYC